MPELPEVETIARGLDLLVGGTRIEQVVFPRNVGRKKIIREGKGRLEDLVGQHIRCFHRRGKVLIIDCDRSRLFVHLGMSGQLLVRDDQDPPPDRHTHLVLGLTGSRRVCWRDPRRFGFLEVGLLGEEPDWLKRLGPEPFDLDTPALVRILARYHRQLKPLLTDQQVVAGIGNIYADEILFGSGLHPLRRSSEVKGAAVARLCRAMHRILRQAIRHRGTTIRDYLTGSGAPGGYRRFLRVYGREGESCPRCGNAIRRIRVAGRSTHFCPRCQPLK